MLLGKKFHWPLHLSCKIICLPQLHYCCTSYCCQRNIWEKNPVLLLLALFICQINYTYILIFSYDQKSYIWYFLLNFNFLLWTNFAISGDNWCYNKVSKTTIIQMTGNTKYSVGIWVLTLIWLHYEIMLIQNFSLISDENDYFVVC